MSSVEDVRAKSIPAGGHSANWLAQAIVFVAGSAVGALVAFVAAVIFGLIPFEC